MISVYVGDEDGLDIAERHLSPSKAGESSWWAIHHMFTVDHDEGVIATIGKERVTCPEHHNLLRHKVGYKRLLFSSSVERNTS